MVDTKSFFCALVKRNLDFFCGVPDSLLKSFCACVTENCEKKNHIIAANEGNAVGLCAGHYLATGKPGVVYMQNSGLGNAVNPLVSIADGDVYSIPMLLIVGWRGEPEVKDEPQHKKQGKITTALLETLGVEYEILSDDYENQLDRCSDYLKNCSKPFALVVRKNTFSQFPFTPRKTDLTLTREEALSCLLESIDSDSLVVSTTGKTSRELFELRQARGENHGRDFLTVGGMGHTASIALGLALGTDKNVWCVDGDGSFIMHMGGFAVAAANAPKNFKYILNNNGAHESVGGQPTVGFEADIEKILLGCGFKTVRTALCTRDIADAVNKMKDESLCALVIKTRSGSRENLGRPTQSPAENKEQLREVLSK